MLYVAKKIRSMVSLLDNLCFVINKTEDFDTFAILLNVTLHESVSILVSASVRTNKTIITAEDTYVRVFTEILQHKPEGST